MKPMRASTKQFLSELAIVLAVTAAISALMFLVFLSA